MDFDPQIERALLAGRKIEAIRRYRQLTGAGLAEARAAVIDMEMKLRRAGRVVAPQQPAAGGSGVRISLLVAILIALLVLLAMMIMRSASSHT